MKTHRFLNNHQIKELPTSPVRSTEDLKRMIRKMELKVTEQRIKILHYLYKMPKHITAQELYECIHPVDPSIGFATIYRFLKRLVENKIISETRVNNMPARYELIEGGHHDHMVCLHCGRISEFYNSQIEKLQKDIAQKLGFILTDHLMELQGYCFQCRSKCPPESEVKDHL